MVLTRTDGVDIDGRRLIGTTRVLDDTDQKTFGEFKINGTARGNNVLALTNSNDLNNTNTATVLSGWTNITNTEGLNLIDVDAIGGVEEYYSQWTDDDTPDRSQNDFYERLKWLTRDGSASTVHGVNGEVFRGITHNFSYTGAGIDPATNDRLVWGTAVVMTSVSRTFTIGEAVHEDTATPAWKGRVIAQDDTNNTIIVDVTNGTVTDADAFTGQTSAETGIVSGTPTVVSGSGDLIMLAVDDDGATGNLYVQVLKGTAPADSATLYDDAELTATIVVSATPTDRSVSTPFVGVSTGSNIIGAYGVGFGLTDIDNSDILTALDGNTYSRPNLVTNTFGGLTFAGDVDRVLVAPWDGAAYDVNGDPSVDKGQMTLNATLNSADVASIVVTDGTETAIPGDTPTSGTIRVTDDDGFERWIPYSSWSGTTFTVNTGHGDIGTNNDFDGIADSGTFQATAGNSVYVTYLDQSATAGQHSWQSTYVAPRDLVALDRNGGSAPIKQFIAEWSLASTSQTLNAIRTTDL